MTTSIIVLLVLGNSLLFWMGGEGVPPINKDWRRTAGPLFSAILMFLLGSIVWWKVILAALAYKAATHLGYGEDDPLWKKGLALLALGVPAVILNPAVWFAPLWVAVHFGLYYWISRKVNWFAWPLAELMCGFSIGTIWALAHLMTT